MSTKETNAGIFDVRLTERLIRLGKLDTKEHEAYLKRLPNDEERAEYIEVYEEPAAVPPSDAETLTFT
jgi:hypothetical protein